MKVLRNIEVPTGNILVVQGDKGKLECLSIGDYGQSSNIKADFLGLTKEINKVSHGTMLPLEEKWVVTVSTQYGCSMGCVFCDVPKVGKGRNATYNDIKGQILSSLVLHPEVTKTQRLNVHYARMGEPTWNWSVIDFTRNMHSELKPFIGNSLIHPVISTMLPKKNAKLDDFLDSWMYLKNHCFNGDAGLQFSINSTSDEQRNAMFSGSSLSLGEISALAKRLIFPVGRKITLNFAVADYEINATKLRKLFDPAKFIVKLTPMHKTKACMEYDIATNGDYTTFVPYAEHEAALKAVGFDVLVFIASDEEDLGRITCGNAILSGTMPLCEYKEENNEATQTTQVHPCIPIMEKNTERCCVIGKGKHCLSDHNHIRHSFHGMPCIASACRYVHYCKSGNGSVVCNKVVHLQPGATRGTHHHRSRQESGQ